MEINKYSYLASLNNGTTTHTPSLLPSSTVPNSTATTLDICEKSLDSSFENIAYAVFMTMLLFASFIGNSLVIVATILSKQLRKRVTVYLIVSLGMYQPDLDFLCTILFLGHSLLRFSFLFQRQLSTK